MKSSNNLTEQEEYVLRYQTEPIVAKASGKVFDTEKNDKPFNYFLDDVAKCHEMKMKIAIVHGGGTGIDATLKKNGIIPQFENGLRITDTKTVPHVIEAMAEINEKITEGLTKRGVAAEPLRGSDIFNVHTKDFEKYGYVGEIDGFNDKLAKQLKFPYLNPNKVYFDSRKSVPVVNPVSSDKHGRVLNVNADDAANELAIALAARLIMLSDTAVKENGKLVSEIVVNSAEFKRLMDSGALSGGMLKKVLTCAEAMKKGMTTMSIIDGTKKNALWNELTTNKGSGTIIKSGIESGQNY